MYKKPLLLFKKIRIKPKLGCGARIRPNATTTSLSNVLLHRVTHTYAALIANNILPAARFWVLPFLLPEASLSSEPEKDPPCIVFGRGFTPPEGLLLILTREVLVVGVFEPESS